MKLFVLLPPGRDKTWFTNIDIALIKLKVVIYLYIVLTIPITIVNIKFLTDLKFLNFLKKKLVCLKYYTNFHYALD